MLLEGLKREFSFEEKEYRVLFQELALMTLLVRFSLLRGENKASEYARKFKANPVEGLKTNPELTEKSSSLRKCAG